MSFKFPNVYDALYAENISKKKYPKKLNSKREKLFLAKANLESLTEEYDNYKIEASKRLRNEKREAYFLGTGVSRPYTAEIIPFEGGLFNPESTKGLIITAKTKEALAEEIQKTKVGEKNILFPPGAFKRKDEPTLNPTLVNRANYASFMNEIGVGEKEFIAHGNIAKVIFGQKNVNEQLANRINRDQLFGTYY